MDTPLATCEQRERDPKGLYQKARAGLMNDFTAIYPPYEKPEQPELLLDNSVLSMGDCVDRLIDFMIEREMISGDPG